MNKVLIVDDHPIIRMAIRLLLERSDLYQIVGETDNGVDAVQLSRTLQPDIVILDLGIPGLDGLDVIKRLKLQDATPKILVFTSQDANLSANRCMQAGAAGFMHKNEKLDELIGALRAVTMGYTYFPSLTFKALRTGKGIRTESELLEQLSDREVTVLRHLVSGLKNNDIADKMALSHKTISTYKTRIMEKLQLKSLVDLVEFARRHSIE